MKNRWIIGKSEIDSKELSLLCIPYAGASASMFSKWQTNFREGVRICPILLPFRDSRRNEKMPESVLKLAYDFVEENEKLLKNSYAIFGHCTGAILGYEIARLAKKIYGVDPMFLIVSSSQEPAIIPKEALTLYDANDATIKKYLKDENLVEEDILDIPEFVEYYYPILREDFKIYAKYVVTKEKLRSPIIAIYDPNDPKLDKTNILAWQQYTEKFSSMTVSGGHYSIIKDEKKVIENINQIIKEIKGADYD